MRKRKAVILINRAWNIYNFRAGLIRALLAQGYEVVAVAPRDAHVSRIEALGCRFVELPMREHGMNPVSELALLWRIWRLLRQEQPDFLLGYTIKPNIYGSWVAAQLGIRVINNISGLGAGFLGRPWKARLLGWMYRVGLAGSERVFFQNEDDRRFFVSQSWVESSRTDVLPGSGVNLAHFNPQPQPPNDSGRLRVLYVGRLLGDKGVNELAQAAAQLRVRNCPVEIRLVGGLEPGNPDGISAQQVQAWVSEGLVQHVGHVDDVRPHLTWADAVVLPSYREGTSRSLLEAMAMGRPIVATDVPGCRELVKPGQTGWLCAVRSPQSLADALEGCARTADGIRRDMGVGARRFVEAHYDENRVIRAYLAAMESDAAGQTR